MNLLDVNVLVALFRADHVHHEAAADWWSGSTSSGEPFTVPDLVWVGFFRLVTHSRIFEVPATFAEAATFRDAVVDQELHLSYVGDPRSVRAFVDLGREIDARADLVTDAYIGAIASTFGATVVTFDRDFRKLDGVRVHELTPAPAPRPPDRRG